MKTIRAEARIIDYTYQREYERFKKFNPQIIAYRNKRRTVMIIKLIFLDLALVFLSYLMFDEDPFVTAMIAVSSVLTVPWFTLKPQKCFSKPWIGTIEDIVYFDKLMPIDKSFFSRSYPVSVNCIRCNLNSKKFFELEQKYEMTYHVGDTVMYISGLDYPVNLTQYDDVVCPKCGAILRETNNQCVGLCDLPRVVLSRPSRH